MHSAHLEQIGEIAPETDQIGQFLGVGHRQQGLGRPAEAAQDRRSGAGFDEGALGPSLGQSPRQSQAPHHVTAADFGPGVGEKQDAQRG